MFYIYNDFLHDTDFLSKFSYVAHQTDLIQKHVKKKLIFYHRNRGWHFIRCCLDAAARWMLKFVFLKTFQNTVSDFLHDTNDIYTVSFFYINIVCVMSQFWEKLWKVQAEVYVKFRLHNAPKLIDLSCFNIDFKRQTSSNQLNSFAYEP